MLRKKFREEKAELAANEVVKDMNFGLPKEDLDASELVYNHINHVEWNQGS